MPLAVAELLSTKTEEEREGEREKGRCMPEGKLIDRSPSFLFFHYEGHYYRHILRAVNVSTFSTH